MEAGSPLVRCWRKPIWHLQANANCIGWQGSGEAAVCSRADLFRESHLTTTLQAHFGDSHLRIPDGNKFCEPRRTSHEFHNRHEAPVIRSPRRRARVASVCLEKRTFEL